MNNKKLIYPWSEYQQDKKDDLTEAAEKVMQEKWDSIDDAMLYFAFFLTI